MRNWNFCNRRRIISCEGFQTTYEELKLAIILAILTIAALAFRLPMRNWNLMLLIALLACSGFQTTYEELKLVLHTYVQFLIWSFQTTYEELKLNHIANKVVAQHGFQTTYEELKLHSGLSKKWKSLLLSDYLWGIETLLSEFLSKFSCSLSDYLWGIETWDQALSPSAFLAFRLPMRNWNVSLVFPPFQLGWLSDYLWGIETRFGCHWDRIKFLAFRLPMRNWNLDLWRRYIQKVYRFQTTYEELKLELYEQLESTNQAFRLPMRNWNSSTEKMSFRKLTLSDYLWGIETW